MEGAGLGLLAQLVGRPAEDGAVVQLVEGRVDQLGQRPVLTEAGVLEKRQIRIILLPEIFIKHRHTISPECWPVLMCC